MPRKRDINAGESAIWLGVLLDAAFDPTSQALNLAARAETLNREAPPSMPQGGWSPRIGRSELLGIASDINDYPDDIPPSRAADLLLRWADRWVSSDEWTRLKARVRKRRQKKAA